MKALFTKISNEERMTILEMHKTKKIMSEQPLPPQQNGYMPKPPVADNSKANSLSCVKPQEYHNKGEAVNSFTYQDSKGENVFYSDGVVRLYDFKYGFDIRSSERLQQLKKGKWNCGSSGNIEVRWEDDPKSVAYYPLPSVRQQKSLDLSKCAQNIKDVHSGKFLFKGCKSPAVTELQKQLGFKKTSDFFGNATDAALRKFQDSKKIKVDGVFGQDTYSHVFPRQYNYQGIITQNPII
jgi:hypothetical protein